MLLCWNKKGERIPDQEFVTQTPILVTGPSTHIRLGPGDNFTCETIAMNNDLLSGLELDDWFPILLEIKVCWIISERYPNRGYRDFSQYDSGGGRFCAYMNRSCWRVWLCQNYGDMFQKIETKDGFRFLRTVKCTGLVKRIQRRSMQIYDSQMSFSRGRCETYVSLK